MPKKTPTSQLSRKECKKRDWTILGGEIWVPSHAARAVVTAATELYDKYSSDQLTKLYDAVRNMKAYGPGVRQDIGGFIDLLCLGEVPKTELLGLPCDGTMPCIIGIQTTARSGMSARRKKMKTECLPQVRDWLNAAGFLFLHGWDQPGGPGKRYRLKEEQVIFDGDGIQFIDAQEPKF